MKKRLLAVVLTLSLVFGSTTTAYAAESAPVFSAPAESAPVFSASESIGLAHEVIVTEFDLNNDVIPYLDEAAVYIDGNEQAEEAAEETAAAAVEGALNDLTTAQSIVEKIEVIDTTSAEKAVEKANTELATFEEKGEAASESAQAAVTNAETANTAGTKGEAVAAKAKAEEELSEAEANLIEATDAYDAAWK